MLIGLAHEVLEHYLACDHTEDHADNHGEGAQSLASGLLYENVDNDLLMENLEALTKDSEIPDKSWYQYLAYTHPCDGWGMKMYCSKLKNKNNDHCHFQCGRQISD